VLHSSVHERISQYPRNAVYTRGYAWGALYRHDSTSAFSRRNHCELFRLFLLNCDHSNKLFLLDCSQFKRNRRNISHFAEKKRPWNQALLHWIDPRVKPGVKRCPGCMQLIEIIECNCMPTDANSQARLSTSPSLTNTFQQTIGIEQI
jgi:hypothetical protein